jgi:TatD family-associated radical SAM protein
MLSNSKPSIVYWLGSSVYLNITNQCSNNCWFCFRNFKKGVGDFNLKLLEEPSLDSIIAELSQVLAKKRWSGVVFCGFGEPTSRLDVLLDVTRWIRANYPALPIRVDTNGHGYALNRGRAVANELKAAGINSVSVSLNGHDEQTYCENCRPDIDEGFNSVLEFVKRSKGELDVEVSAVRMPEVDIEKVKKVVESLGVRFRVRDYIPCFW